MEDSTTLEQSAKKEQQQSRKEWQEKAITCYAPTLDEKNQIVGMAKGNNWDNLRAYFFEEYQATHPHHTEQVATLQQQIEDLKQGYLAEKEKSATIPDLQLQIESLKAQLSDTEVQRDSRMAINSNMCVIDLGEQLSAVLKANAEHNHTTEADMIRKLVIWYFLKQPVSDNAVAKPLSKNQVNHILNTLKK